MAQPETEGAERIILAGEERLESVIDSAPEMIFSLDPLNRVDLWNRGSKRLTGFDRAEVVNWSVDRLGVFDDPDQVLGLVDAARRRDVGDGKLTLRTKGYGKRVLSVSVSPLIDRQGKSHGVLFFGRDITPHMELHQKLLEGAAYLIWDADENAALGMFTEYLEMGYRGLLIARKSSLRRRLPGKNLETAWLVAGEGKGTRGLRVDRLVDKVAHFASFTERSIILLEGMHFLFGRLPFREFMDHIFRINERLIGTSCVLLIRLNPDLMSDEQVAMLESELTTLSSLEEDIMIEDRSSQLLRFVHEQNDRGSVVSIKKLMKELGLSYATVDSRLEDLEKKGLLFTRREGKVRAVYITDKGRSFITKGPIKD